MTTLIDEELGASTGTIAIQVHGGTVNKVKYRNIQITEL